MCDAEYDSVFLDVDNCCCLQHAFIYYMDEKYIQSIDNLSPAFAFREFIRSSTMIQDNIALKLLKIIQQSEIQTRNFLDNYIIMKTAIYKSSLLQLIVDNIQEKYLLELLSILYKKFKAEIIINLPELETFQSLFKGLYESTDQHRNDLINKYIVYIKLTDNKK